MADEQVRTYDPKKVNVIFGGKEITGFAEDSMISIKPMGEGITSICGADGEVSRSMDPDTRGEVTISLLGSSQSNNTLSDLHASDRATGSGMQALQIKDLMGTTVFSAPQAWVRNYPEKGFSKQLPEVEWVIETGPASWYVGGNL